MTTSQISLPSPRTWSAGDLVTVPRLRADVANAVALLTQPPYFVGQCTTGPSIASATATAVPMNAELTDTWNAHLAPPATATDTVWCQLPGWYWVDIRVPWQYASATPAVFHTGISGVNNSASFGPLYGATLVNGAASAAFSRVTDLIQQTVSGAPGGSGDYIKAIARQDSGSGVALGNGAGNIPTVAVRWAFALSGTTSLPVPPLTGCPTPITSAWLNGNVRDAVRFLIYPPALRVWTGSGSLTSGTLASPSPITMAVGPVDNYSGWSTNTYTAPVAGRYLAAGQINLAASSTATYYACGIRINGSTVYWGDIVRFAGTSLVGGASVTKRIRLNAGDTVQMVAVQNSGGTISINSDVTLQTRLCMLWEGI